VEPPVALKLHFDAPEEYRRFLAELDTEMQGKASVKLQADTTYVITAPKEARKPRDVETVELDAGPTFRRKP
jgi:hypothetical protein